MRRVCGWCNEEMRSDMEWREHRERHTAEDRARLLEPRTDFDPLSAMRVDALRQEVIDAASAYMDSIRKYDWLAGSLNDYIAKRDAAFDALESALKKLAEERGDADKPVQSLSVV